MSKALVVRTQRHKKIGDAKSPMVYTLKRKPKDARSSTLNASPKTLKPWAECRPKMWCTSAERSSAKCARR